MASLSFALFKCAFRPDFKLCKERLFGIFALGGKVCTDVFLYFNIFNIGHITPISNRALGGDILLVPRKSFSVNRKVAEGEMTGISGNDIAEKIKIFEGYVEYLLRLAVPRSFYVTRMSQ